MHCVKIPSVSDVSRIRSRTDGPAPSRPWRSCLAITSIGAIRCTGMRAAGLFALSAALWVAAAASAAWRPDGVDLTRPRLSLRADDLPVIHARLDREPYIGLMREVLRRARNADGIALDDHAIAAERLKSRAAKSLAFLYAIDRTVVDGAVVPFASAEERRATGRRAHDFLLSMYDRSRLAVPAPLGGWDRDISTSEELQQYATAYDTLLGGGYDFGTDQAVIAERLAALAGELYDNYVNPETAQNYADLHQNNHRAKVGAALVTAAVALAEYEAAPGSDPRGVREPAAWLEYGLDQADLVMRYALVTGDGAYGEGPFYFRYTSQNLLPFWRAWDRLVGGADWTARGVTVPSHWRHPLLARGLRWALDMTVPDGSLAPQDDGNPGRCYYFGAAPAGDEGAFAWRWANCPTPFDTDGNITLAPDAIVHFDDALAPLPPSGSPTAFYVEGGNAIFRSDWGADAVLAILQAEHDTASEFGRDREGRAIAPQSHEHAEPGAFMLYAFGERLALDPGYFSFTQKTLVDKPQDHNVILVDGAGPQNYLAASFAWLDDPFGRPPVDGHATLSDMLDGAAIDGATVTTRYGQPAAESALIARRALFLDDRYLLFADAVAAPRPRTYTWLLHGNGGGDSGGTFTATPSGGRWQRPRAGLETGIAFDVGAATFDTVEAVHEEPSGARRTHAALHASATGSAVRGLQLVYPWPTGDGVAPPQVESFPVAGGAGLRLRDDAGDRRLAAVWRGAAGAPIDVAPADGGRALHGDGVLVVADATASGDLRVAWAEAARSIEYPGGVRLACDDRGNLGYAALSGGRYEVIADCADPAVVVRGLPVEVRAADGACALRRDGDATRLALGRERRVVLRTDRDHSAPAADAGEPQRVAPPQVVTLGGGGCDADGDALSPRWELVSAPAGSAWSLQGADLWSPQLFVDRPGPYRVRLTVTDARGEVSRPAEVLIVGGEAGSDGIDNDLDGWFDGDDADGEATNRPPSARRPAPLTLVAAAETIDLAALIADADGDALVYRAAAAGDVAAVTVDGRTLVVRPLRAGTTSVIVSAADAHGARTFATIPVAVVDACPGDCGLDGTVTIDELTLGLRIALGAASPSECAALDRDGDRQVDVAELLAAVRRALDGCGE